MSAEIRRLIDRVQEFADAIGAWQDSDEGGYDGLIAIACEAKDDFDHILKALPPAGSPKAEEIAREQGKLLVVSAPAGSPPVTALVNQWREQDADDAKARGYLEAWNTYHVCANELEAALKAAPPVRHDEEDLARVDQSSRSMPLDLPRKPQADSSR